MRVHVRGAVALDFDPERGGAVGGGELGGEDVGVWDVGWWGGAGGGGVVSWGLDLGE